VVKYFNHKVHKDFTKDTKACLSADKENVNLLVFGSIIYDVIYDAIYSAMKNTPAFSVISLGCPKNLTDSELMVRQLTDAGFRFHEDVRKASFVLLNTCGFLKAARNEAREILEELVDRKKRGRLKRIFVTGCAVQWEKENLARDYSDVDAWFGVFDEKKVAEVARQFLASPATTGSATTVSGKHFYINGIPKAVFDDSRRHLLTFPHVAYLKIADGCSRHCAYCAIPQIRGPFTSRPKSLILEEARRLADVGVRELIVIAQETNFWGTDLYGKPMLAELLAELEETAGVAWIRLMYTYPMHFTEPLVSLFAAGNKLLPYIDLPLQHASDSILATMNRRTNRAKTEEILAMLRERIENLVLRTSLIVGFPGETEEMFGELLDFVEKWQFERTGVFAYSQEDGTVAANLPDQIDDAVKRKRQQQLYELADRTSSSWAKKQVGKQLDVLIDQSVPGKKNHSGPKIHYGRSYADAPTIDPVVFVNTSRKIVPGETVRCEIVETDNINLIAVA